MAAWCVLGCVYVCRDGRSCKSPTQYRFYLSSLLIACWFLFWVIECLDKKFYFTCDLVSMCYKQKLLVEHLGKLALPPFFFPAVYNIDVMAGTPAASMDDYETWEELQRGRQEELGS